MMNKSEMLGAERRYRRVWFKECGVAGMAFHVESDDELWDELEVGDRLVLVRDRNNKHDRNAVAVALADDYEDNPEDFDFDLIIGYVPRAENAELAALMDAGYADKFSAEITDYKRHGSYDARIRMTIYVESREPEIVRPDLLRAKSLTTSELGRIDEELAERGMTCFLFGGYPHHELQLPIVGDKMVMVRHDTEGELLYLMRVLATGDDCAKYFSDNRQLTAVDDRVPFVFTNVMGPIKINAGDYPFLSGLDLDGFEPTQYLSQRVSDGLKELFKSVTFRAINRNNVDMDPSIDEPDDFPY